MGNLYKYKAIYLRRSQLPLEDKAVFKISANWILKCQKKSTNQVCNKSSPDFGKNVYHRKKEVVVGEVTESQWVIFAST